MTKTIGQQAMELFASLPDAKLDASALAEAMTPFRRYLLSHVEDRKDDPSLVLLWTDHSFTKITWSKEGINMENGTWQAPEAGQAKPTLH